MKYAGIILIALAPYLGIAYSSQQEAQRSFTTLSSWFTLPTFKAGNPVLTTDQRYIVDSFGNKTFNLCVLSQLARKINSEVLLGSPNKMLVPAFTAISNDLLTDYLNKMVNLETLWDQFTKLQGSNKELQPDAGKVLLIIRDALEKIFADTTHIPDSIVQELMQFIAKHKNNLLMVRSTGREDRTDIANAGGNESVASVTPTVEAIWKAMGIVIESYFSEKSFRQRLLAGDTITEKYFIPVLIQVMIGEQVWTGTNPADLAIPVSGVMFTQESAGATQGVVQIQTAYGHNQGVVNSLVAVDTFYMGTSGVIHPIIRVKADRFVTVSNQEGSKLERVANPEKLQKRASLTSSLVTDLSRIARKIQETYNFPMDIEFVVDHKKGGANIFLVQARPLIETKFTQEPTYLSDQFITKLQLTQPNNIVKGETIGTAGGFVRTITNNNEILFADELPQALNSYHDNPERARIKAVIVTKMAPTTSHEATQFRSYAVPVLCVSADKRTHIEQLLTEGQVLIDTQRALVVQFSGTEKEVAALTVNGWYAHPIQPITSVGSLKFMLPQTATLHKMYPAYSKELQWTSSDRDTAEQSLRDLLTRVKQAPTQRTELLELLKRILHRVQALQKVATLLPGTKLVLTDVELCSAEILSTFDALANAKINNKAKRMAYLYPITFLEATLFQQDNPEIVSCFSYLLLLKTLKQEHVGLKMLTQAFSQELEKLKSNLEPEAFSYFVQFEKITPLTLNPTAQKSWQEFVSALLQKAANTDKKIRKEQTLVIKQFATTLAQLKELGVLDLWVNSTFIAEQAKIADVPTLTQTLIQTVAENKELISWINQIKLLISTWEHKIDTWGDPAQFAKLFKQFDAQFVSACIRGEHADAQKAFKDLFYKDGTLAPLDYNKLISFSTDYAPLTTRFAKATSLGKLMLLQLIKQIVSIYDQTIKGMTGSPAYKDKTVQVKHFAQLLVPYIALMEEMIMIVRDKEDDLMLTKAWHNIGFSEYLDILRKIFIKLAQKPDPENLHASRAFSVGAAQIGSKVDFARAQPGTLEDIFTLAHQNMLMASATLNLTYGITKEMFPEFIQEICAAIESINIYTKDVSLKVREAFRSSLIGIDYQYPNLTVLYNMPLRQHSATFEIIYRRTRPNQATLICKFFGHNESNRMLALMTYARLAALASNIDFVMQPRTNLIAATGKDFSATTEYAWNITKETSLKEITAYLQKFANMTMSPESVTPVILNNIHKIHPFIPDKWAKILQNSGSIDSGKLTITAEELPNFMLNAFPILTDQFFSQDMLMSAWFINHYIKAKLYDKALRLIEITLSKILRENNFDYPSNYTVSTLWKYCLESLLELQDFRSQEKLTLFTKLFSSDSTLEIVPDKREIVELVLQNLQEFVGTNKQLADIIEKLIQSYAKEKIENAGYKPVYAFAADLIKQGNKFPQLYKQAFDMALQLTAATSMMVVVDEDGNKMTDKRGNYIIVPNPNPQYEEAEQIAQELEKAGQQNFAQQIRKAIQAKISTQTAQKTEEQVTTAMQVEEMLNKFQQELLALTDILQSA